MIRILVISLLLFSQTVPAGQSERALSRGAIARREGEIRAAFKVLTAMIPRALSSEKVEAWLTELNMPRTAYEQSLVRVLERAQGPLQATGISYRVQDSGLLCVSEIEGQRASAAAYVPMDTRVIHLCDAAFGHTPVQLAQILLHEYIHVQGIRNECDTEALVTIAFRAAGIRSSRPSYLNRCRKLAEFVSDLD